MSDRLAIMGHVYQPFIAGGIWMRHKEAFCEQTVNNSGITHVH